MYLPYLPLGWLSSWETPLYFYVTLLGVYLLCLHPWGYSSNFPSPWQDVPEASQITCVSPIYYYVSCALLPVKALHLQGALEDVLPDNPARGHCLHAREERHHVQAKQADLLIFPVYSWPTLFTIYFHFVSPISPTIVTIIVHLHECFICLILATVYFLRIFFTCKTVCYCLLLVWARVASQFGHPFLSPVFNYFQHLTV